LVVTCGITPHPPHDKLRQVTQLAYEYVSIRQHASEYVSIRQHTSLGKSQSSGMEWRLREARKVCAWEGEGDGRTEGEREREREEDGARKVTD
jgi:hypothetical protein